MCFFIFPVVHKHSSLSRVLLPRGMPTCIAELLDYSFIYSLRHLLVSDSAKLVQMVVM